MKALLLLLGSVTLDGSMCNGGGVLAGIVTTKPTLVTGRKRVLGHPPVACAGGASWESAHLASIWENKIWQSCFTQYALISALLFQRPVMISSADLEAGQY